MKFKCKDCGCDELIVTHFWDILTGSKRETWQEWGYLDDSHHVNYQENELIETEVEPDDDITESETDNHEFFVECANCEREIEFGWSHPNRGGRIWPVECDDFVPGLAWMEPRYLEGPGQ